LLSTPYIPTGLLCLGGIVLAGLAAFSWQRRAVDAGTELTALLMAAAIWVFSAAAEHLFPTIEGKILASKIQYIGILTLPPASLATVLVAIGRRSWVAPCMRVALPLVGVSLLLVMTNEWHGGVWSALAMRTDAPFPMLAIEYGPVFWAINAISHSQLVAAAALLLPVYWKDWRLDATLVYLGLAAPWAANLLYVSRLSPFGDLDITPFGLIVTGVAFTASLHGVGNIFSTIKLANQDVIDHISDLVLVLDERGRLLSANRAARDLLGTPPLPAPTTDALSRHPELLAALCQSTLDLGSDVSIGIRSDGDPRIFDVRAKPIYSRRAARCGTVVVLRDITDQRNADSEIRLHRQQLRQIVDLIPHPIYARDDEGRFILANDATARAYGTTGEALQNRRIDEFHADRAEVERILENDRRVIASQEPLTTEEAFWNGKEIPHTYRTTKIPFERDGLSGSAIAGMSIDVTEERERARMLQFLASTDPLTNLSNRRHFQDVLERALQTAERTNNRAALLFMDLDRFKMVNDNYGHPTGDAVLKQVADRIQEKVRFTDQVARPAVDVDEEVTVSRLGGDEFMVLLPSIDEPGDAAIAARRLREALIEPFDVGPDRLQLGASVGIAIYPDDGLDSETLVRHCDQALTNAKRTQRGRVEFYNASISAAEERRYALEVGLRRAIERGEFRMVYQPIRDVRSARLDGAEALIRWTSAELGDVAPDEFIPVAEESGLVVPIGLIAVRSVCEQIASWRSEGLVAPRVSVNVSARQLADVDSPKQIARALEESGVSGDSLEFELTEGSVLSENPMVEGTLAALGDLGASLALDDFGTGYSSLSHLRRFCFQRLKIDRSFVAGLGVHEEDEQLVRAIIALAKRLEIRIVAEGVETEEQFAFLREEECDFVQGYLFGRPMPASDLASLLDLDKTPDD
jgi:diguanylate cyclase (GGDEF)-like protein/PAS domain S-box-containing protein